jgi:molybdopterin adenylyltransferase
MHEPGPDPIRIGLVATSDRASQGVYRDEGIPALEQWLAGALVNPIEFERRLIPDERPVIEATLRSWWTSAAATS